MQVGDVLAGLGGGFLVDGFEPYTGPLWPGRIAHDRLGRSMTVFDDFPVWVRGQVPAPDVSATCVCGHQDYTHDGGCRLCACTAFRAASDEGSTS